MKRIKVNTESIGSAKKVCANELQILSKAVSDMDKSVTELNATWKGGNHDKFAKAYLERYKLMQKALELIESYLNGIDSVNKKYESCESDVSGLASF